LPIEYRAVWGDNMATVRKRKLPSGLVVWRASYTDGSGKRRTKQFPRKSDGEAWLVETRHDVARGTHTPGSLSPTVKEAAALWIKRCEDKRLEPTTVDAYKQHVDLHIVPRISAKKLSDLTVPAVNAFADELRESGMSAAMITKVIRSLGAIFKEARRRGLSAAAPTVGLDLDLPDREDPRPEIPTKAELQFILGKVAGRWRPLVLVATFCGLRGSELRGLRWIDADLQTRKISVSQRADASHRIGKLKSKAGYRSIHMPPIVVQALREWKLVCPKGDLGLVFPNKLGKVESHSNVLERGLHPVLLAGGMVVPTTAPALDKAGNQIIDAAGKPQMVAAPKYGMHSLRHACASLWIESGYNPKQIQKLMGHSSIKVTFDVYGHLFADDEADQRAAEDVQLKLMGSVSPATA
jgi:integrase